MITEKQILEMFLQFRRSERDIMILIDFYRGVSIAEIARDEGLSSNRVWQIINRFKRGLEWMYNQKPASAELGLLLYHSELNCTKKQNG